MIDLVCADIHAEMDSAKPKLCMVMNEIAPQFIAQWDINGFMKLIGLELTPVWTQILEAATETKEDQAKSKSHKLQNCHMVPVDHLTGVDRKLNGFIRDKV